MSGRTGGRVLLTALFTDIVDSTAIAGELGDRRWQEVLRRYHEAVRSALRRFDGAEVDTAGDGSFATFLSPAQAIRCAVEIVQNVRELGLEVRIGIHTGEAETAGQKVAGIAVHLAARVYPKATPGEILVTGTTKDLVMGSRIAFRSAGTHDFKGIAGHWPLFAAASVDGRELEAALPATEAANRREGLKEPVPVAGKRRSIVAAAIVGTLVLGGIGFAALRDTGAHRSTDASERTTGYFPILQRTLDPSEQRLLSHIPIRLDATCGASLREIEATLRSIACRTADVEVRYSQFEDSAAMDQEFDRALAATAAPEGECASAHLAVGSYSIEGQRAGRVQCYRINGRSQIEWTDERLLVFGSAVRGDLGDLELYRWWLAAGPTLSSDETRGGVGQLPQDIRPGAYEMSLYPVRASIDCPLATYACRGRYQLELREGIMTGPIEVKPIGTPFGSEVGTAFVLAKGQEIVFYPAPGDTFGKDPGDPACLAITYRWSSVGGRLRFRLARDPCRDYADRIQADYILTTEPWDLRNHPAN